MLERSKHLSLETLAAVEKLTAELNEFTTICRNIRADLDLLADINPQTALLAADIIDNAIGGAK